MPWSGVKSIKSKYHENKPRRAGRSQGGPGRAGSRAVSWVLEGLGRRRNEIKQLPPTDLENRPRKQVNSCSEIPRQVSDAENRAGNTTSERRPRRQSRICHDCNSPNPASYRQLPSVADKHEGWCSVGHGRHLSELKIQDFGALVRPRRSTTSVNRRETVNHKTKAPDPIHQ